MERDTYETPIMFRKARSHPHEVIAIFPAELADHFGLYHTCYAHVGQHGSCLWHWIMGTTRPATIAEYVPLKRELEGLGYRVQVVHKRTRSHIEHARTELDRINASMKQEA